MFCSGAAPLHRLPELSGPTIVVELRAVFHLQIPATPALAGCQRPMNQLTAADRFDYAQRSRGEICVNNPKFIDVDGVKTRYFDEGSGEVLLLVHGSHMGTPDACESARDRR